MADEETLALSALLNLSGQLLGHKADIKRINTQAQIAKDQMQMQMAKDERTEKIEMNKALFQLTMGDIKVKEVEYAQTKSSLENLTGQIIDPSEGLEQLTSEKVATLDNYQDILAESGTKLTRYRDEITTMNKEIETINQGIAYTKKHMTHTGGTDPEKWDVQDYTETVGAYYAEAGITPSDYLSSAMTKSRPGENTLRDWNLKLTTAELEKSKKEKELSGRDITMKIQDIKEHRDILTFDERMMTLIAPGKNIEAMFNQLVTSEEYLGRAGGKVPSSKEKKELADNLFKSLAEDNPLLALVGMSHYLKGYGPSVSAPEYFVNNVIAPSVHILQATGEFLAVNPRAEDKFPGQMDPATGKHVSDAKYHAYNEAQTKQLNSFLGKLSKALGISGLTLSKVMNAKDVLRDVLGEGDITQSGVLLQAQQINHELGQMQTLGLAGYSEVEASTPPSVQATIDAIKILESGDYEGKEDDEIQKDIHQSLNLLKLQGGQGQSPYNWKRPKGSTGPYE